jgi:hypothetical protein
VRDFLTIEKGCGTRATNFSRGGCHAHYHTQDHTHGSRAQTTSSRLYVSRQAFDFRLEDRRRCNSTVDTTFVVCPTTRFTTNKMSNLFGVLPPIFVYGFQNSQPQTRQHEFDSAIAAAAGGAGAAEGFRGQSSDGRIGES